MKYLLFFTCLCILKTLIAQHDHCFGIDTIFHQNGRIACVSEIDSLYAKCGQYQKYDTTGILIEEGFYEIKDSVECINCFHGSPGYWTKYAFSHYRSVKIGTWKYYYGNGSLKMIGSYSGKVYEFRESIVPRISERDSIIPINKPVPIVIDYETLKTGEWNYYDEQGVNYLTEQYIDGVLVERRERR